MTNLHSRTRFYKKVIDKKIHKSIIEFPNANLISMNFSHIGGKKYENKKTLMFCDWTIKYLIEKLQNREYGALEKIAIKNQEKEIANADYVVTLFPSVQKFMEKELKRDIIYLGNVINSEILEFDSKEVIENKYKSNSYLFIGRKRYIESLKKMINTIKKYNLNININVIGLEEKDDELLNQSFVKCYGYLSKNNKEQRNKYYELIMKAKAIVNTTENWNGMSSLIECMYYNLPIIVVPNENTIETFGKKCEFGCYLKNNSCEEIKRAIDYIENCDFELYKKLCEKSHELVSEFTWDNYIKKIMRML